MPLNIVQFAIYKNLTPKTSLSHKLPRQPVYVAHDSQITLKLFIKGIWHLNDLKVWGSSSQLSKQGEMLRIFVPVVLTFFIVLIATVSMKLAVERSRMMEWMSQVHLPRDPRETCSRSRLSVSSLLEPRVVVSPSCISDIHPKLVQSGTPPFRYSHLQWPPGARGVVGMTNTVPFSLSVQPWSSLSVSFPSMHVSPQLASSSTENTGTPDSCLAALCSCLWEVVSRRSHDIYCKAFYQTFWEPLITYIYMTHREDCCTRFLITFGWGDQWAKQPQKKSP